MTDILYSGMDHVEALTHSDPDVSCLARMASSQFAQNLANFLNAEVARGTSPVTLMTSLARFQVQSHACLTAQFIGELGYPAALDLYKYALDKEYLEHAERARSTMKQRKRA
ncbi:hypothetical protein ACRQ1B_06210 [Rhizobium panacihumi]|uniref:hypothetical protein n=1 Tax=Rhizobium panacihumi TaxID=2008450 RepID=UPI003D7B0617